MGASLSRVKNDSELTRQGLEYRRKWRDRGCVRVCRCGCGVRFEPKRRDHVYATVRCGSVHWYRLRSKSPQMVELAYSEYLAREAAQPPEANHGS